MELFGPPADWKARVEESIGDLAEARKTAFDRELTLLKRVADLEAEVKSLKEAEREMEQRLVERVSNIVFNRTQEARKVAALRRREEREAREYDETPRMPAL